MSNLNVCFGRWNDWKSKIICWVTRSEWSHVWLEYESAQWQSTMVVHADSKGVMIEPLTNFHERRKRPSKRLSYKVMAGDVSLGFAQSKQYLGKDYGYLALFKNAIILLLLRFGVKNLSGAKTADKFICSEFALLFLQHSNVHDCELDAKDVWPGRLAEHLETLPEAFEREE